MKTPLLLLMLAVPSSAREGAAFAWQWTSRYSGSGLGSVKENGRDLGGFRSDTQEHFLRRRFRAGEKLNLVLGASFERTSLTRSEAPLPDHLQSVAARLHGAWVFSRRTWMTADLNPGLYGDDVLVANDFNAPAVITFHGLPRPDVRVLGGLSIDLWRRRTPVFPFVGMIWQATPRLVLRLAVPTLQAEYRAYWKEDVSAVVFGGLHVTGGQHRVSSELGRRRGRPEIGGQILSYSTRQAIAGIRVSRGFFESELFGGWAWARRLEYARSGPALTSDGVPSFGASLTGRF